MDVKSLMIGDLVCYDGDVEYTYPVKVDGLTTDDISLDGEGFLGGIDGMVMPIPLTAEILEKNGWKDSDPNLFNGLNYVFIRGQKRTLILKHWVNYKTGERYYAISLCGGDREIKYVHELQHALRLCGLNDLADNFKVE